MGIAGEHRYGHIKMGHTRSGNSKVAPELIVARKVLCYFESTPKLGEGVRAWIEFVGRYGYTPIE
jgi:hypothetical protein